MFTKPIQAISDFSTSTRGLLGGWCEDAKAHPKLTAGVGAFAVISLSLIAANFQAAIASDRRHEIASKNGIPLTTQKCSDGSTILRVRAGDILLKDDQAPRYYPWKDDSIIPALRDPRTHQLSCPAGSQPIR